MRGLLSFIFLAMCLASAARAAGVSGASNANANASASAHAADVAQIQTIVEQFKAAIIAHDGKTIGSLFVQDHDSWLSVADEAKWAKVKPLNPNARKVFPSSWKKFAEFIQNDPKSVEERFYNVRIDTNGAVASVWFDFDFLVDGKVSNRGSESWQMVRAEDGWKISSMLYSVGD
ncbi:MAG: nuclear transport factor 2 family protein [Massilia sp.]